MNFEITKYEFNRKLYVKNYKTNLIKQQQWILKAML